MTLEPTAVPGVVVDEHGVEHRPTPAQQTAHAAAPHPPAAPGDTCTPQHGDACDGVHPDTRLVTTDEAALDLGLAASGFSTWARRRGLEPVRYARVGRSWRALYDLDAVYRAERDHRKARP